MSVESNLLAFRIQLLQASPFYGDILTHLVFEEDSTVETAATNGRRIFYNRKFMQSNNPAQQNFIWMHEVMHIILLHSYRCGKKNPYFWNIAADLIVNQMLTDLMKDMKRAGIPFERPDDGLFSPVYGGATAEHIYEIIKERNEKQKNKKELILSSFYSTGKKSIGEKTVPVPRGMEDLIALPAASTKGRKKTNGMPSLSETTYKEADEIPREIRELIANALKEEGKGRSLFGHSSIPAQVYDLQKKAVINWKSMLKRFLTDAPGEDTSYATPERKYIHMDLIIPGHGESEDALEEVWAFLDCSGSVGKETMSQFLAELRQITREFHCILNVAYWDTKVGAVYEKIRTKKELEKALPTTSGGTDINCVYRWIRENKKKPDVMLILTDGYFGKVNKDLFLPKLRRKTILVLSEHSQTEEMKMIGKIASLK